MEGDKQSLDTFSRSIVKSGLSTADDLANGNSNEEIIEGISIPTWLDAKGTLWSRINSANFSKPIYILGLGGREKSLKKGGLLTVAHLIKWAEADFQPPVRHVGKGTIGAIRAALEDLCERPKEEVPTLSEILEKIDPNIANTPVTSFHLGPRASSLQTKGYDTVRSLASWYDEGAPRLANFGKTSVEHAKKIIEGLPPAIDKNLKIDWDIFCARTGITLLPETKNIPVGPDFLRFIPKIIEEIVSAAADSVEADIVSDRLAKFTAEQHTLEELGLKHGVTRERIRQKQKKLLRRISEGLLDGHYETAQYRFRPEYAALWQEAEEAFNEQEELNANSFFEALTTTWKVTRNDLIDHLPFIFAVLTKSGRIPGSFKIYARFPQILGMELPGLISVKPLQELRLGRYADLLETDEIKTVGDLLQELVADEKKTPNASAHTVLAALDRIESFIEQLDCIYDFSWEGYYEFHGRTILPDKDTQTPTSFLESLKPVILRAVEEGEFHQYSREILIYRSFPPKNERITSQEIANMVGTHGPTISRNELVMNTRLKAQLVAKDFSRSSIIFRDSFLVYWKELSEIHERCSSVSEFKFKMTNQWNLVPGMLDDTINLIWSILSFHPPGKNSKWYEGKKKPRKQKSANNLSISRPPVIILRKKRSIH